MYSPATRLLTALDLLQSRPRVTASQLAERLEVDARSVRRYIGMLEDLGIPIEAERGRYGGYRVRPGFKLPPLMLTEDEAVAVTLGLLAAQRLGLAGAVPAVERALARIERVLPVALRERVQAVQGAVALDLPPPATAPAMDRLVLFSGAAHQRRRLWMRYEAANREETERELDCYGLVYHGGRWYAVGYCHLRRGTRVFRLDRVLAAEPREERFARPPDFDCLAYAIQAFAAIPDTWLVEVVLATALDHVRLAVPPAFATLEEHPEGVVLRAYDRDLGHTARFLVGLDCPFRVVRPPELLDALRQLADNIVRMASPSRNAQVGPAEADS
jgi:predicted DNA-binding transcriptional regulator YafY